MKTIIMTLCLLLSACCQAQEKVCVVECKITLDADEFIAAQKGIFIKASIVPDIINKTCVEPRLIPDYDAWNILEFKVFIYIECKDCGGLHLVDHGCTNPNCPGRTL